MSTAFLTPADLSLLLTGIAFTAAAGCRRTVALRGLSALAGLALAMHGGLAGRWTWLAAGLVLAAIHGWHGLQRWLCDREQRRAARRAARHARQWAQAKAARRPMPSLPVRRFDAQHTAAPDTLPLTRGLAPLVSATPATHA